MRQTREIFPPKRRLRKISQEGFGNSSRRLQKFFKKNFQNIQEEFSEYSRRIFGRFKKNFQTLSEDVKVFSYRAEIQYGNNFKTISLFLSFGMADEPKGNKGYDLSASSAQSADEKLDGGIFDTPS